MDLNDVGAMRDMDPSNVYGSIAKLADQAKQAWNEIGSLTFPASYRRATALVVSGMGGSSIGAHLVQAVYRDWLLVPFVLSNDYHLPNFVGKKTLVVLSSYSGGTEEVLMAAEEALEKKAMITGITTGGGLADFLREHGLTGYVFEARHNPAGQPRLAMGYSVVGQAALFAKLGYISIAKGEIEKLFSLLEGGEKRYGIAVPLEKNPAKLLAQKCFEKIPVLVAAAHTEGAAHIFANQLNESSKTYSEYRVIPELNHHLMEGLSHPHALKENLLFVLFSSTIYGERIQARFQITREVVEKNGLLTQEVALAEDTPLLQAFELVLLGSYLNYYLAILNGVDPQPIPWVSYFKKKLQERFS